MSKARRRSMSWMKEPINPPIRIDVASLDIGTDQHELDFDTTNNEELRLSIFSKIETARNDRGHIEEINVQEDLENPEQNREKQYLEHYFRFLHCVGLASFKEFWKTANSPSHVIHRALTCLLTTLAIFDSVKLVKVYSILSLTEDKGDMYRYVVIGRYIFNCAIRIYFVSMLFSGSRQIARIFAALDSLRATYEKYKVNKVYVFAVGLLSVMTAILNVIFGWVSITGQGESWSPSEVVLEQSMDMSLSFFVWTTNITKVDEQHAALHSYYGEVFTPITVTLGVTGIVMGCVGLLVDLAINDIMFFSAVSIYKLGKLFQLKISDDNLSIDDGLKLYQKLQNVSNCIEDAFGMLFRMTHANNLLLCANIVLIMVSDTEYTIGIMLLVLQILKVWITYYLAVKAAAMNNRFRRWIRRAITEDNTLDYDMKLRATTFLNESLESPLGIGSETFFIDEIFVLKFLTMVGTFSMFLIDKKKSSELG